MSGGQTADGHAAEGVALAHLQAHGLRCLARNFRTRRGEIDLVMRDGGELVFVEVRQRRRRGHGDGLESVTAAKRRRLVAAAAVYLQRCRGNPPCRFDVVALDGAGGVTWVADAFTLDD